MNDLNEITEIVCKGTLEQLTSVLDTAPDLITTTLKGQYKSATLLEVAVVHGDIDKVALIIERGADPAKQLKNMLSSTLRTRSYSIKKDDIALLTLLVEKGATFPEEKQDCLNFIRYDLDVCYTNNLTLFNALIRLGFDPVKTEEIARVSIIYYSLECRHGTQQTSIANKLLSLGCSTLNIGSSYADPLKKALSHELYAFVSQLLKKGSDSNLLNRSLLENVADHPKLPETLRDQICGKETDFNQQDSRGDTALHRCCYHNNTNFMSFLVEKGADLNILNEEGDTPLLLAIKEYQKESIKQLIILGADVNQPDTKGKTPLDIAMSQASFKRVCTQLVKAGAKTCIELKKADGEALDMIQMAISNIHSGKPWANTFRVFIESLEQQQAGYWYELIRHCLDNNMPKPSKRWTMKTTGFIDNIGDSVFKETLLTLFPLIKEKSNLKIESDISYDEYWNMRDNHSRLLKGLLWSASRYNDQVTCRELRNVATHMYKKVPGVGMRNAKVANAALYSLSQIEGIAGLQEITILRAITKYNSALTNINRIFTQTAKEKKMTVEALEALAIPDYGLTDIGYYTQRVGEYTATLRLLAVGKAELTWKKGEKSQKSIPAVLKREAMDEVKELKLLLKDLNLATRAHSQRFEQSYLKKKPTDTLAHWRDDIISHPLLGFLARRLIWRIQDKKIITDIIYTDKGFVDAQNNIFNLPKDATVCLWHPIMSNADDVLAWREWLMQHEMTQPFKQAHREIYPLTDAERKTVDHSLRYANHILKHGQFNALCTQRGWKQTLGGYWDGGYENEAYKYIESHNITVEFEAEGTDQYGGGNLTYQCVGTSAVTFTKSQKKLKLEKIEPLLFSEVMRDVDLFVGVSSIGNDPQWHDRTNTYWEDSSFGKLSASAKTRYEVLEVLLPKLKIASQLTLEGRFLLVEGKLCHYKIHLGSSNILMQPNDSYLCIVAARANNSVMLPFEGDNTLSLILSKAFMLANDSKIRDKTILSQIKPMEAVC
ncbi:MAG: DUF4132 domain-containing protein [Cocleimonas sp.]|nr:DUF4132 domain-containing protein [Cocleimonas sp.]